MAWKPKTIAGKILKGLAIGVGVAAAGALVVGTAGAAIPAIGGVITASKGVVGTVLKSTMNTVDAVGTKAADLVSGITKEQRDLVQEQRDETKEYEQKLTTIEKLVKAGATVQSAASQVGVSLSSLAGLFGLPSVGDLNTGQQSADLNAGNPNPSEYWSSDKRKMLTYAGIGIAALFFLPKLFKGRR
jgi:uncharacterized protein YoxC